MLQNLIKELEQTIGELPITMYNLKRIKLNTRNFFAVKYKVSKMKKTTQQIVKPLHKPISQIPIHDQ